MRAIDADTLFKAFANSEHIKETTDGLDVMEMLAIKEIIDNAPTLTTQQIDNSTYLSIYNEGYLAGLKERAKSAKTEDGVE